MRRYAIHGQQFEPACMADIDLINNTFTDRAHSPFRRQRFPLTIEHGLIGSLRTALSAGDRQLLIARHARQPVAFMICSTHDCAPALYLAGVWPQWRGRGFFCTLAESMILQCRDGEYARVYVHPDMALAIRQLKKLGYWEDEVCSDDTCYRATRDSGKSTL